LLDAKGSLVEFGDLQMVPVSDGVLWARPIYVESQAAGQRQVEFVVVNYEGRVGLGRSLTAAIADVFPGFDADIGDVVGSEPAPTPEPGGDATAGELLTQAEELFAEADAALEAKDLATYAEKVAAARALVQQAIELIDK